MTKNISTKTGHRGGNTKADKKSSSQTTATTIASSQNVTANHSQNEVANSAAVQKASIDSKMLTPEQRRLANLMNDKVDVSDIEKKISKIMELTGASKDKAIVALHDCANELDKAIDMILEGDSINESEWKSQTRKKKPKTGIQSGKESSDAKVQLNGQAKKLGKSAAAGNRQPLRNKQQQPTNKSERAPFVKKERDFKPREQNNNDESASNKELSQQPQDDDDWQDAQSLNKSQQQTLNNRSTRPSSNENQFKSHKPSYLQDQRGKPGKDIRDGGQRGPYDSNRNSFGQGGDRGNSNQRHGERRTFQNKNYNTRKPGERSQYNSIDTWTNNMTSTDSTNQPTATADYAQMTVGNWSDVVSSTVQQKSSVINKQVTENLAGETEDWVEPNKVFNKDNQNNSTTINKEDHQIKMPNLASIVSGVKPPQIPTQQQQHQQQQQQQQTNLNKSLNQKQSINQLGNTTATIATSQNSTHQLSSQQTNLHKSSQQPQRSPQQQQQQNKIDLAGLFKSGSQQPQPQQPQQQQQQQPTSTQISSQQATSNLMKGNLQQQQPQRTSTENKSYGAAILQSLQRPQNAGNESNKPANLSDYVNNPYSNAQLGKNLVHNIPSSNYNSQNASSQLFDSHHLHHQNVNDQQTISDHHQKSLIDKTRRRQTKIPETAVEMPNSEHISSLNVQFGALDFGADSYLNDNNEKQATSLLSTIRGDKQPSTPKDVLHNQLDQHQQLPDNLLDTHTRSKPAGYQQKSTNSLYSNNQQDNHPSIYQQNLQQYGYNSQTSNNQSSYSVNNYGSQNHNSHSNQNANANQPASNQQPNAGQQSNQANNSQKINLKDLDISSSNSNSSTQVNTTYGLTASNTTVTTNVLKNSLTATGKSNMQQPNVPPLLGTPQYIMNMSQQVPGLSAFYPIMNYADAAMPAMADHSFRYNQNSQDVKYNRTDANDGVGQTNPHNVQSTQAQVNQQQNHQIFGQFPHPYGLFYTGFYPTPSYLPVQPNVNPSSNNQHANTNHSTNFPPQKAGQNQQAYSSTYTSNAYDHALNAQIQSQQDYKQQQNYGTGPTQAGGNQNQQAGGKQMSNAGGNDSNMYSKTHAQLTKNYDKQNFNQVQTPPPFGITAMSYQNQYIPMLQPQSQPSMLHHSLQGSDANQTANSGVSGNQRGSLSQQKQTSNTKNYYWN